MELVVFAKMSFEILNNFAKYTFSEVISIKKEEKR